MSITSVANFAGALPASAVNSMANVNVTLQQSFQASLLKQQVANPLQNTAIPAPSMGNFYGKSPMLAQFVGNALDRQNAFTHQINNLKSHQVSIGPDADIGQSLKSLRNIAFDAMNISQTMMQFSILGNGIGAFTSGINTLLRQG